LYFNQVNAALVSIRDFQNIFFLILQTTNLWTKKKKTTGGNELISEI